MGLAPSLTVLCATKGRTFLEIMVASQAATQLPGDRLILFGDGVPTPPCALPEWAEWRPCAKATEGVCGHLHLFNALNAGVPGDYIALMGDDDVWLPGAFGAFRHVIRQHKEEIDSIFYPTTRGTVKARGERLLFRNRGPFPPFGPGHRSDGEFYGAVASRGRSRRMKQLVMVGRACFLKEEEWTAFGLGEVAPWKPWFETTRSREDEWPSGMPPGFQSVPKS